MKIYDGMNFEQLKKYIKEYFELNPSDGKIIKPSILLRHSVMGITRFSYVSMNDLIKTYELIKLRENRIKKYSYIMH